MGCVQAERSAIWDSILRYVAMENAPSMYLTVAFFSLTFDNQSWSTHAKNVISFALSAGSAMSKVRAIMHYEMFGLSGGFVGIFITAWVIMCIIKMAYASACPSHLVT